MKPPMFGLRARLVLSRILISLILLKWAVNAGAVIFDEKNIKIDFTSTNAAKHCFWSPQERYGITPDGLGWDRSPDGPEWNGGSILTHPVGIGFYWRPATSARVKVDLKPGPREARTADGTPYWWNAGRMFVRHSPDLVHWSSWQELSSDSRSNRVFQGSIGIPGRERDAYESLRIEFQSNHEAGGFNEEATVQWIVKNDPRFFAKHLPFIGYVQLLFEGQFVAGERFRELNAVFSYAVGGGVAPPADGEERARFQKQMFTVPWRYEGPRDRDH